MLAPRSFIHSFIHSATWNLPGVGPDGRAVTGHTWVELPLMRVPGQSGRWTLNYTNNLMVASVMSTRRGACRGKAGA